MTYRALDWVFTLDVGSDPLSTELRRLLAPLETAERSAHRYALTFQGQRILLTQGDRTFASREPGAVAQELVSQITDRAVESTAGVVALHAGCVASGSTGIVLPGPSGSGKSTLVAALVQDGLSYLTDELTAIDVHTGCVRHFAKPIVLKSGSWGLVEWRSEPLSRNPHIARLMTPSDLSHDWVPKEHVHPAVIAFPTYVHGGGDTHVTEISTAEAVAKALGQCMPSPLSPEQTFETVIDVVKAASCYDIHFSSMSTAIRAVRSIVGL